MNKGLFCQLVTIPLFRDHKILVQVAGHANRTIKLLPALVIDSNDCEWIENAFDAVIAESHKVPGPVWALGKTLVEGARLRRGSARPGSAPHAAQRSRDCLPRRLGTITMRNEGRACRGPAGAL